MFFNKNKSEDVVVKELRETVASLKKVAEESAKDHAREIENLKKDNQIVLSRKDAELDVKIATATKSHLAEIAKLKLENGNYKKEVEILTKAFENLGFDVKDMKEILTKLVDGIVSKNTIQLVK